jgi:HEAT repeat protein
MKPYLLAGTALVLLAVGPVSADIPKKADVPRYIKQLQTSPNAKIRATAAEALGHRGAIRKADVTAAIDPLIKALQKDKDANVRKNAAEALGKIAPDENAAVKPLIDALKDKAMNVRIAAASALGLLGPAAEAALPALREVQKEVKGDRKKRGLARAVGMAIRSISGKNKK